ncbi:MAG: hypothetical protein H0T76_28660 [Nannocystis sp.]|nr:hypothetical protein [Nannocystis sp.]MBA3550466.1 hypothetical protein [Nannocystis sp.]
MLARHSLGSPSASHNVLLGIVLILLGACTTKDDQTTDDDATGASTAASTAASTETGEPTEGSAVACPDHASVDACCCFELIGTPPVGVSTVCAAEQAPLCPKVKFECDPSGLDTPEYPCVSAEDEAAVDCALKALAGVKPGSLHIEYIGNNNYWYRNVKYALQGDGTTYLVHSLAVDASEVFDPTGRFTLKAPAYFTDCLAQDIGARGDCLRSGVMGAASEVCLDEFDNQNI